MGPSSQQGEPARTERSSAEQAETSYHREFGIKNEGTVPNLFCLHLNPGSGVLLPLVKELAASNILNARNVLGR